MKWWDWMSWSSFFECWILSQLLHSLSLFIKRLLSPSLLSAIKEFIDISPENLDSRTAFHMMYSAYKLNKQGDKIQPWRTPFPIWNQSTVPCPVLTVASWPPYTFLRRQLKWSDIPISLRVFHSLLWSTQSKTSVVIEVEWRYLCSSWCKHIRRSESFFPMKWTNMIPCSCRTSL